MSKGDNSPGLSKLAGLIGKAIDDRKDTSLVLDFGVINEDYSLTTHTFPVPIKKDFYMVCRHLRAVPDEDRWYTEGAGSHSHEGSEGASAGLHTHKFQPHEVLDKGDRVLVAWVQNDPVVVDVVVHANEVF